jgi:hypothetical protein
MNYLYIYIHTLLSSFLEPGLMMIYDNDMIRELEFVIIIVKIDD